MLDPTPIVISGAPGDRDQPAISSDGTNAFVVWADGRSEDPAKISDIYGAPVSRSGSVLDATGRAVAIANRFSFDPSVAFDGTNYLVAWVQSGGRNGVADIYAARVRRNATVVDPTGFAITGHQRPARPRGRLSRVSPPRRPTDRTGCSSAASPRK